MSIGVENNRLVMDPQNLRERLSVLGITPVPARTTEADPVSSFTANAAMVSNEGGQLSVYDPIAKGILEMSSQAVKEDVVLEPVVPEYVMPANVGALEPTC